MIRMKGWLLITAAYIISSCRAELNLTSILADPLYISSNFVADLDVSLGVTFETPENQVSVEMQISQTDSSNSEIRSQFIVSTNIICPSTGCSASSQVTASVGLPLVDCQTSYNETLAIRFFLDSYLLPCHKPCWYGSGATFGNLQNAVLSEFAGVDQYASVLSRGDYPSESCLLGFYFRSSSTDFTVMAKMLAGLQIASYADTCPQITGFLRGKKSIGCARLHISVEMPTRLLSVDLYRDIFFTPGRPNNAPRIIGGPQMSDLELDVLTPLGSLTLNDPDANYIHLTVMSNGLVIIPSLPSPPPVEPSEYVLPPFTPVFWRGGFNTPSHIIDVNATLDQAAQMVRAISLVGQAIGLVRINITANDEGGTGYPAIAQTLQATVSFVFECKPSIRAPTVSIINSDETFRIDWRPGMQYLKRGRNTTIPDEFFPCGGDTMRGFVSFPQGGTGTGLFGWSGKIPPGGGSSANLTRDCAAAPSAFFTRGLGEKSMYLTLDEGGKARAYIQTALGPSGCEETGEWKVIPSDTPLGPPLLNKNHVQQCTWHQWLQASGRAAGGGVQRVGTWRDGRWAGFARMCAFGWVPICRSPSHPPRPEHTLIPRSTRGTSTRVSVSLSLPPPSLSLPLSFSASLSIYLFLYLSLSF